MFKVSVDGRGRFGNNLIQYFAVKIFCANFSNYTYTTKRYELGSHTIIQERSLFNLLENNHVLNINSNVFLEGFFQNLSFLDKHREFIKSLFTSNNNDVINHHHYEKKLIIKDLIVNIEEKPNENDLVLHIRLDDFIHQVHNSNILDIEFYINSVVESNLIYKWNTIWIVVDKLENDFDKKYINLLITKLTENGIINIKFHQKTFLEDWNFCIQAVNFISSNSTFALTAILLSNMKYVIIPSENSWSNVVPLSTIEVCRVVDVKRINTI